MIRDMALRGFSPRTHESYIAAVVRLAKYYHRSPDQIANEEVQTYLAHLIQERKLSWSTCSQAAHAVTCPACCPNRKPRRVSVPSRSFGKNCSGLG